MSGTASVALATLAALPEHLAPGPAWLRPLYWAAAVICLIGATYRAWLIEHRRANGAEASAFPAAETERRVQRDRWLKLLVPEELRTLRQLVVAGKLPTNPALVEIVKKTSFAQHFYPGHTALNETFKPVLEEWYRDASKPRRLSADQAAKIRQALNGTRGTLDVIHDPSSSDAFKFAEDLAAAFRAAGWNVCRSPLISMMRVPAPSGIAVEYPHDGMPGIPDPQLSADRIRDVLQAAMSASDLDVNVRERTEMWSRSHGCIIVSHPSD